MNYGSFIHNERKRQGLSMYALAKKAGVSDVAIKYWEQGDRGMTLENADKVFRALGVSITIGAAESETK